MKFTPENITQLLDNQIFIFGSNTRGVHGAGAALFAKENFEAVCGIGEGMCGPYCYAFPTKNYYIKTRKLSEIERSVIKLIKFVKECPEKEFLLTKVGMGYAGLTLENVAGLFKKYQPLPSNLILPKEFHDYIYSSKS